MPKATEPKTTQDDPTAERPVDEAGRTLDEHGLPLNGPARLRALDGNPDPRDTAPPAVAPSAPASTDSQD